MTSTEYDVPVDTAIPLTSIDPAVAIQLDTLCASYRRFADDKAANEAAMKALLPDIVQLASRLGVNKIRGGGWLLVEVPGSRSDIDARKLLAGGVSIETINDATVRRTWSTWQVRNSKDDDSG